MHGVSGQAGATSGHDQDEYLGCGGAQRASLIDATQACRTMHFLCVQGVGCSNACRAREKEGCGGCCEARLRRRSTRELDRPESGVPYHALSMCAGGWL